MYKSHLWRLSCSIFLLWNHTDVIAADVFKPYVSASVARDSNLFRSSKDSVSGDTPDTISRIEAGMQVNYPISRQHLSLKASVNRNQYQRYEFLNYDGNDVQAVWNWQMGNLLQGDLGYTRNQTLASFTDTQVNGRDVRTQQSAFANANYRPHPDWRLHGGGRWYALESESSINQLLKREEVSGVVGVDYISNANNSVGIQGYFMEARFPDSEAVSPSSFDNGYSQVEISSVANWAVSGNSRLRGRLGYTQSRYNQLSSRDSNNMTGRFTYDWSITGKTMLSGAVWREIGTVTDTTSTFSLTKGSSLDVSWVPTSKISVRGGVAYRSSDFQSESGFVLGVVDKRKDDIRTASAALGYSPLRNILLSLEGIIEQRDSTRMFFDYSYKLLRASVKVEF